MAIINNLYMQVDGNNIPVHPYTEGNAVWINQSNGYNLMQALEDLRNNAASEWNDVKNKPFNAISGDFKVVGGRLQLNGSFSMEWDSIQNKPAIFNSSWGRISGKPTIFPTDWGMINNKPIIYNSDWNLIGNKPDIYPTNWESIENVPANFNVEWIGVQNRPFFSINLADFDNSINEELSIHNLIHFVEQNSYNAEENYTQYIYQNLNESGEEKIPIPLVKNQGFAFAIFNGFDTVINNYYNFLYNNYNQINKDNFSFLPGSNLLFNPEYYISSGYYNYICGDDNNYIFSCPENSEKLFSEGVLDYKYIIENQIDFSTAKYINGIFDNTQVISHNEYYNNTLVSNLIFNFANATNLDLNKIFKGSNYLIDNHYLYSPNARFCFNTEELLKINSPYYINLHNNFIIVMDDFLSNEFLFLNYNNFILSSGNNYFSQRVQIMIQQLNYKKLNIACGSYNFTLQADGPDTAVYLYNIKQPTKEDLLLDTNYFTRKQGVICFNANEYSTTMSSSPNNNRQFTFRSYLNLNIIADSLYLENIHLNQYSYWINNYFNTRNYDESYYNRQVDLYFTGSSIYLNGNNIYLYNSIHLDGVNNKLNSFTLTNYIGEMVNLPDQYFPHSYYSPNIIVNHYYLQNVQLANIDYKYYVSTTSTSTNISNILVSRFHIYNVSTLDAGFFINYQESEYNINECLVHNLYLNGDLGIKFNQLRIGDNYVYGYNYINNNTNTIINNINNIYELSLGTLTANIICENNVKVSRLNITPLFQYETINIQSNQIEEILFNMTDYSTDSILYQPENYTDTLKVFRGNFTGLNSESILDFNTDYPVAITLNKQYNNYATYIYVIKNSPLDSRYLIGGVSEELENNNGWYFPNNNYYILNNLTNHKRHKVYFQGDGRKLVGFGNPSNPIRNISSEIFYFNPNNTNYHYTPYGVSGTYLVWDDNDNCFFGNSYQNLNGDWTTPLSHTGYGSFMASSYVTPSSLPIMFNTFFNMINVNNLEEWYNNVLLYDYGMSIHSLQGVGIIGSENENVLDLRFLNSIAFRLDMVMSINNIDTIYINFDHPRYNEILNNYFTRYVSNIKHLYLNNLPEGYAILDFMCNGMQGLEDINLLVPSHHGTSSFGFCTNLKSANITIAPKNVSYAYYEGFFMNCNNLTNANLIVDLSTINYEYDLWLSFNRFFQYTNLTNYNFNYISSNKPSRIQAYCLNMYQGTNISNAILPNFVYYGQFMFERCYNLTRVEIQYNFMGGYFNNCFSYCNHLQYMRFAPVNNKITFSSSYDSIWGNYLDMSYLEKLVYIPSTSDIKYINSWYLGTFLPCMAPNAVALDVPDSKYFDTYCSTGGPRMPSNVVIASYGNNMNYGGLWNNYITTGNFFNLIMAAVPEHISGNNGGYAYYPFSNLPLLVFGIYPPYCDSISYPYYNCSNLLMFKKVHNETNCYQLANFCSNLVAIQLPFPRSPYDNGNISYSFYNCANLRIADLRTCNNLICQSFIDCPNLQILYLNDDLKNIGYSSFLNSKANLEKIEFNGSLLNYSEFNLDDAYKLHYPIKSDGNVGLNYKNCTSLISSYCGNNTKSLYSTYNNCSNLIEVQIGPNAYEIYQTFMNCTNLSYAYIGEPTLPSGITYGGYYNTYENCSNIRTIIWKNNNIHYISLCDTFRNCRNLTTLNEVVINAYTMYNTFIDAPIDDNNIYIYANGYGNVFSYYNNAHRCNVHVRNRVSYNYYNLYAVEDQENFAWTPAPEGADYNYYNENMNVYLYLDD